jgi:hypothetical protein
MEASFFYLPRQTLLPASKKLFYGSRLLKIIASKIAYWSRWSSQEVRLHKSIFKDGHTIRPVS